MRTRPTILFFGPVGDPIPDLVRRWAERKAFPLELHSDPGQIESIVLRGHPCLLFIDADRMGPSGLALVRQLKSDPFTAIIPALVLAATHQAENIQEWFSAGADEILTGVFPMTEQEARLDLLLIRTQRDVSVHPSTAHAGHHRDREGDPPATGRERRVRGLLRRPGSLQGIQRPVQLL